MLPELISIKYTSSPATPSQSLPVLLIALFDSCIGLVPSCPLPLYRGFSFAAPCDCCTTCVSSCAKSFAVTAQVLHVLFVSSFSMGSYCLLPVACPLAASLVRLPVAIPLLASFA